MYQQTDSIWGKVGGGLDWLWDNVRVATPDFSIGQGEVTIGGTGGGSGVTTGTGGRTYDDIWSAVKSEAQRIADAALGGARDAITAPAEQRIRTQTIVIVAIAVVIVLIALRR